MSTAAQALQDLQTSVTGLTTAVGNAVAEFPALIALITTPGVAPADVEAAVTNINTLVANLQAAVVAAQQSIPAPSVPTPAPVA